MRKTGCAVMLFAVLLPLLSGCASVREPELPTLVIGCSDYRPYTYFNADGEPAGIGIEFAREACRRLGYEPLFKQIDRKGRENALESGEVDCLWSFTREDTAGSYSYRWVGPYMYGRRVAAVLNSSRLHSVRELEDKSVAIRAIAKSDELFSKENENALPTLRNLYCLSGADDVVTALRNDYVDACVGYAATLTGLLETAEVSFRFLDEDLPRSEFGAAFSPDADSELVEKMNAVFTEMIEDGTKRKILEEYDADISVALWEGNE